jgi:hypothetical protein
LSVFVVLGLIWAAVLVPPVLRARAERRAEFIDSFRTQMGALGKKAHAPTAPIERVERVKPAERAPRVRTRHAVNPIKRRRDILGGLIGAIIGSAVLGALPSLRMVWALNLFLVNVCIGYLALLAHQRRHLRVRPVVHHARTPARVRESALAPALRSSH